MFSHATLSAGIIVMSIGSGGWVGRGEICDSNFNKNSIKQCSKTCICYLQKQTKDLKQDGKVGQQYDEEVVLMSHSDYAGNTRITVSSC